MHKHAINGEPRIITVTWDTPQKIQKCPHAGPHKTKQTDPTNYLNAAWLRAIFESLEMSRK